MTRAVLILNGPQKRLEARKLCDTMPAGSRVTFKMPQRSIDQNSLLWALLTDIAKQLTWSDGKKYPADDWKDYMMHALRKARWMPDEDGGYVPIGMRSSDLSKEEFSDLIELIKEFGARHGVVFTDTNHEERAA